jgi:hypothetical protein
VWEIVIVPQRPGVVISFIGIAVGTTACGAAPNNVQGAERRVATPTGNNVTNQQLPINQRFKTLDEYLAWLQEYAAPTDQAWYREIRPGVYELQTGNFVPLEGTPGAPQRVFTREELEEKFGFRH